ncbi:hypothetical protein [Pseudanabaena mucicola]|uniref:Uncharacterized protein n=1 Tax=Pseudanabaena mucicola FACHB-723 TaxID=2692860 RepID=A0ABR8A2C5_9CYAN|nr:hypothetical protein [Pseudanabaena mucicola]MBD2189706.1 hypothetical protein [Pseudanabaena mucicola FACHB-723]
MKKYTFAFALGAMTLLIGYFGEKAYKEKSSNSGTPQVAVKKSTEVYGAAEAQIVCDKFKLVTKVTGSTLDFPRHCRMWHEINAHT